MGEYASTIGAKDTAGCKDLLMESHNFGASQNPSQQQLLLANQIQSKLTLNSRKQDEKMNGKFHLLEPSHVLYVLLAANFLAVLYCPSIFSDDANEYGSANRDSNLIQKTPMGDDDNFKV